MDVPRIGSTTPGPATTPPDGNPATVAWSAGQRLVAHVLQSLGDGEVVLSIDGRQVAARSAVPLSGGQTLELEVVRNAPVTELRVLGKAAVVSDQQYAVASLQLARAGVRQPTATPPQLIVRLLHEARHDGDAAQAATALALRFDAVPTEADPVRIAERLRDLVEQGGLLLEARLRAALEQAPDRSGLPPALSNDARVLLGLLRRKLVPSRPSGPGDPGLGPPGVSGAVDPPDADAMIDEVLDQLAARALQRQVEAAYHWVRDDVVQIDVPLRFGAREAEARLRFGPERDGAERSTGGGHAFSLFLVVDPLGRMDATVRIHGTRVWASIVVEREDVARLVESEAASLASALEGAGFTEISTGVRVDTAHLDRTARPDVDHSLPPGGSILSARA